MPFIYYLILYIEIDRKQVIKFIYLFIFFVARIDSPTRNDNHSRCINLGKHLSKSASELSCRDCGNDSVNNSPQRTKSAANPSVTGVIQKTHGFFNTLKVNIINYFL